MKSGLLGVANGTLLSRARPRVCNLATLPIWLHLVAIYEVPTWLVKFGELTHRLSGRCAPLTRGQPAPQSKVLAPLGLPTGRPWISSMDSDSVPLKPMRSSACACPWAAPVPFLPLAKPLEGSRSHKLSRRPCCPEACRPLRQVRRSHPGEGHGLNY